MNKNIYGNAHIIPKVFCMGSTSTKNIGISPKNIPPLLQFPFYIWGLNTEEYLQIIFFMGFQLLLFFSCNCLYVLNSGKEDSSYTHNYSKLFYFLFYFCSLLLLQYIFSNPPSLFIFQIHLIFSSQVNYALPYPFTFPFRQSYYYF